MYVNMSGHSLEIFREKSGLLKGWTSPDLHAYVALAASVNGKCHYLLPAAKDLGQTFTSFGLFTCVPGPMGSRAHYAPLLF